MYLNKNNSWLKSLTIDYIKSLSITEWKAYFERKHLVMTMCNGSVGTERSTAEM